MTCSEHPRYIGESKPNNHCSTCWDIFDIINRITKNEDGREFTEDGREIHTMFNGRKVIGPPVWYLKQLEVLRKLPPPTVEQVRKQFKTCARLRKEMDFKELKTLCHKMVDDKLTLDEFLDECQMIYLSRGWNIFKRESV